MKEKRKKQREKTRKNPKKINVGDVVLYKNIQRKSKLATKWTGPYVVSKVSSVGLCKIKDIKNKRKFSHIGTI